MLKNREKTSKIRKIIIVLITTILIFGVYINVIAIDSGNGTIKPIYRPIWEKVSSSLNESEQKISILIEGTAEETQTINSNTSINYSSVVTSTLEADDITVYVDGEEASSITKSLTTPTYYKADGTVTTNETEAVKVRHTLTLSNFEQTTGRQTGKNFKEWSGNIKIRIGGRGEDATTYTAKILTDKYGNQSMMSIDETGEWVDITYQDVATDKNTNGTMFTDFIKPEYTYEYSSTNPDINTGIETVTVVFDVTDKYFESTALATDTNGSLITVIVDEDENANTPITKTLTKIQDLYHTINGATNHKVGERYQLTITGLDQEDGYSYSGPMTLVFGAGAEDASGNLTAGIRDKSGNLSDAMSITMGVNEPGGNPDDDIVVDVVDPIWQRGAMSLSDDGAVLTVKLKAIDKYYKTDMFADALAITGETAREAALATALEKITVYVNGVPSTAIRKKITGRTEIIAGKEYEYTLELSNIMPSESSNEYTEFTPSNESELVAGTDGFQYKTENGGQMKIEIASGVVEDNTGNTSNTTTYELGMIDSAEPEVYEVQKIQNATGNTETIIFNVTDRNYYSNDLVTLDEITLWIDNVQIDDLIENATLTYKPIKQNIDGVTGKVMGHQYTLVISNIAETAKQTGKTYLEWTGTLKITLDKNAARDMVGNTLNVETTTITDFIDYIKPQMEQVTVTNPINTTDKTYTMSFNIIDKYLDTSNMVMKEEIKVYVDGELANSITKTLSSAPITATMNKTVGGVVTNGTYTIGHTYTLVLSNFEQTELQTGKSFMEWSGTVKIEVDSNAVNDTTGNNLDTAVAKRTANGHHVDFIKPVIEEVEPTAEIITADATNKTETIVFNVIDKYLNTTDAITTSEITVYVDEEEVEVDFTNSSATGLNGSLTLVQNFTYTVNGDATHVVGQQYKLELSDFEQATRNFKQYKDFSGTVRIQIAEGATKDTSNNTLNTTTTSITGDFVDYIKPDIDYKYQSTDVSTTNKKYIMTFEVTDKYYTSGTLELNDLTILMQNGQRDASGNAIVYNLQDELTSGAITLVPTAITKTFNKTIEGVVLTGDTYTIGHSYTLTISNLEQIEIKSGLTTADYSGIITVAMAADQVVDSSNNKNSATTITSGVNFSGGIYSGTEVEVDVVDPIWEKLESSALAKETTDAVSASATTGKATIKVRGTDTYLNASDSDASTLTVDEIYVYVDGDLNGDTDGDGELSESELQNRSIAPTISTVTKLEETRTIYGTSPIQTETVQYGVEYTITLTGWIQNAHQVKIKILKDAIKDETGNGNKATEFIIYNTLKVTSSETAATSAFLWNSNIERQNVHQVLFVNSLSSAPTVDGNVCWDASQRGDKSILAWRTSTAPYTVTIGSNDEIFANQNSSYLFAFIGRAEASTATKIFDNSGVNTLELLNVKSVTNMDRMFQETGYTVMITLNLGEKFDTSNVTTMECMFLKTGYTAMTTLTLGSNFNTAKVTSMKGMFRECGYTKMTTLQLGSKFYTSNVINMGKMFNSTGATAMTSLYLGENFDTSKVTNMERMFYYCGKDNMTTFSLGSKFDTSSVTVMEGMFIRFGQSKLASLDLGDKFDTSKVTNMYRMFYYCGADSMATIDLGPLFTNIPSGNVTDVSGNTVGATEQMLTNTGKSGCIIYAPESIYKNKNAFKLNSTDTTETPTSLQYTIGTIDPYYRPEWSKVSSSISGETISIVIKGEANKNEGGKLYSSNVTSTLTADDITVYINGEMDGDIDGDGILEGGETPSITKTLTPPSDTTDVSSVTYTLKLSNFEEATRQTGRNFLEWSGNIAIKIGGRGEATSIYTPNILTDSYGTNGNQNMMETDQVAVANGDLVDYSSATWLDVVYKDADSTTNVNTSGKMFTDFIKPEYTYEYSTINPNIDTGNEEVTVVFDVTDKYFESTALEADTTGSLITVIVDEDENANTPITKVLTKIKDIYYDKIAGITYVNPGAIGTGTKVGEQYQLVITGLDREDGFSYSGPMTLAFGAGAEDADGNLTAGIRDDNGNLSNAMSITMGVNEPGGDPDDDIVVDVVDPIWKVENLETTIDALGNISATMELIGVDKYFKQSILTVDDIRIKVDGVEDITSTAPDLEKTLGIEQYIKLDADGNYVVTENEDEAIGVKYLFSITGLRETDETFFENRADYNTDSSTGRPYREYSGQMTIVIPANKLEDETGNKNNQFEIELDHVDTLEPEVIKVSGTPNINATNVELSTYTVVFDIVDKYINSSAITEADTSKIHVYLDGEVADTITKTIKNIDTLTDTVNGTSQVVGYRYELELSGFENARTEINYDRLYTDWSGNLSIKIDANTATDTNGTGNAETILYGNEANTEVKSSASHVDFIKPDATYKYLEADVDKANKTFKMVFELTDKFYGEDISITDLEILMSAEEETGEGEDGYYNLMDIPVIRDNLSLQMDEIKNNVVVDVVNGENITEERLIGKRYTLVINHLEHVQRVENNYYLDYSGSITITIPDGILEDTSGNGNDVTSITSGIDIPGGAVVDIETVDVVSPIWEREAFTTDIHNQTATLTLLGTDKYFYEVDDETTTEDDGYGTLTLDEIKLFINGSEATGTVSEGVKTFVDGDGNVLGKITIGEGTKLYEQRIVPTEYSDVDVDTGYTTETVQYGIRHVVTITDMSITENQIRIQLTEASLVDESGNTSNVTNFLVYNALRTATDTNGDWETEGASGFLGNATIARQDIEQIVFVSSLDSAPTINGTTCWDVSGARDNSILAWYSQTTAPYIVYIGSNDDIYGNYNSSYLFSYIGYANTATKTDTISGINLLDTRNVTNMSYMFNYCGYAKMTTLPLGENFDTSRVTDMSNMFNNCGYTALTALDLSSATFNTSNVEYMSSMFKGTGHDSMTTLNLGENFDTSNVTIMDNMFSCCGKLAMTGLSLGNKFNTAKVTNMVGMFNETGWASMTSLDLGNKFDTSNVINMNSMFKNTGHTAMTSLDLGDKFNTSKVTDMYEMFRNTGSTAMTSLKIGGKFDTSKVTNMMRMFNGTGYTKMTSLDLGDLFYTTSATNMYEMFKNTGRTAMTVLDLGPAFTKIASGNVTVNVSWSDLYNQQVNANQDFITDTGKSGCTIYAPESIYKDRTHLKLNTNSNTTLEYTIGTINPVYKPEWEKVSSTINVAEKSITITFKGYANETFTKGSYTGDYLSTITSSITAGNDSSNLLVVKVDGEVAEEITQTVTEVSVTENEVQYTIKLSEFEEDIRQTAKNKNFLEWTGNIAVQPVKGTLIDIYGNKNMISIDNDDGNWLDIEFRDTNQNALTGNWTDVEDNNTDGIMFTDYIKPEFTYVYSATNPDIDGDPDNRVTIVFDVTDKYFESTALASDATGSLITVKVDEDSDTNTAITKTLTKIQDLYYTINGATDHKVGERYQLVIDGLESSDGIGYSGPLTLTFAAGSKDGDGNLITGIVDKSGNLSDAMTITMGINEPDYDPEEDTPVIVDVVNPVWSYADSEIDRTNNQVNIYIIGSDKYYLNDVFAEYIEDMEDGTLDDTSLLDDITVYVDNTSARIDTNRDGALDGDVRDIIKILTDITAEMQTEENATRLAELIAEAGLTDKMTEDNKVTNIGVIYKLTLSNFGTISGETKVVIDAGTIKDISGNVNTQTTIEVGNVTWVEDDEPLESGDAGYPRYPAFRNDIVDFINPIITYEYSTIMVDTDGDGTADKEFSANPDIDYDEKEVTVKFKVTDKYFLESDLIDTGNIPKNMSIIIGGETVYVNDGDDSTTDTRIVTTSISATDIKDADDYIYGKEYTLVVSNIQQTPNNAFDFSGVMQLVFDADTIDDTSGNKNVATTITLDTEIGTGIVDVVDPIIYYSSSTINRTSGLVELTLIAEDKYLSSEKLVANIGNINIKIVDLDGETIILDNTTISKVIERTVTTVNGYDRYTFKITLAGFDTDETMQGKADDYVPIKGVTSIIIPENMILDTSGNGNVETIIPVGNPSDTTAFKNSLVDCVSPVWEYEVSSIDRDRYDNGIEHNETGTVTLDVIVTDKFFDETYFTDESKQLELTDIKVYVDNDENTSITKAFATKADGSIFKEYITRTLTDGTTAPYGVRYRLILSNFGTNEGTVKIEIAEGVKKDTSRNQNAETQINVGNTTWVENDEPLLTEDAGYPKYTAFRYNFVDFINPIVTYTYEEGVNPIIDRDEEKVYIKFNVTDTNFLESNIGIEDVTIYMDTNDGNGNTEIDVTDVLTKSISTGTAITDADGKQIGYTYTLQLSQLELNTLLGNEVFERHSGRIRFVIAEGQVEDTSGNKNIETSLVVDYDDGTNTGVDIDDYINVDFIEPIIYYKDKYINWNERYATITLRATDRWYDYAQEISADEVTLYQLNDQGEWIDITNEYYDETEGIERLTISKTAVTNEDGYSYGYDFTIKLSDFEEEYEMKIVIAQNAIKDTSENYNQETSIEVELDNRKPIWEYVSSDTTKFETDGEITFNVKGEDKFLNMDISELLNSDVSVLLDGDNITDKLTTITVTEGEIDSENNDADGIRSMSYQIVLTGLTEDILERTPVGTYTLLIPAETLIDDYGNTSAATTITFSKSAISSNTGNYTNITYHVTPDLENIHSSYVHELMSVNTSGTNGESTTYRPSSLGELNNDGKNPLFAEPMYEPVLEADGYTVRYDYAPKSFAGWGEADEDGNFIAGGTVYGLYAEIPNTVVNLKAVWQDATVVFVSDSDGNNENDGKLPTTPVKDIETALSKLSASGTAQNNIIVIMDEVEWNSTTTITKPVTITSLYAGVDYRATENAELKISSNMTTNTDITFDNIELYTDTNILIANYADITIGRRVSTPNNKYTFEKIIGGNYQTETTTGTIGTHTVRVEAGRYENIIAGSSLTTATTTTKIVTHEVIIGNMKDSAVSRNDKLTITGYLSMGELTGATNTYVQNYANVTLYSGTFTSEDMAIYMRSLNGIVDGNTIFTMYGGEVNGDIYGGSSRTTEVNASRVVNTMKFYGGKVVGNIYGQGLNDIFIGTSEITLAGIINITGDVFGASNVTTAGHGDGIGNTNITIETVSATVNGNIYGGSNGLDNSGYLTGTTNITVNVGTLTNIYGSGKNTGNSGDTNIKIINGEISGNIVGGAYNGQTAGTTNITVEGGVISGNIFGGNENTTQSQLDSDTTTQDATIIIQGGTINGIIYGGGAFDTAGTVNIQLIEAENVLSVYGASNVNTEIEETNITLNGATASVIYGGGQEAGVVEEANIYLQSGTVTDVYGGGYAADVITSNITLEGTATVTSIYGGSNASATEKGEVTTSNVMLTSGTVTNVFGGGNSSDTGTANVTLNGITIDEIHGGSKDDGTTTEANVVLTSGTVTTVFGGGLDSDVGTTNITHQDTVTVTTIYGGNNSGTGDGGTVGVTNINITDVTVENVYGGNYLRGTTTETNINIAGEEAIITGKLYGGGYKSTIGTATVDGTTTINISGGTIQGNINGGSEQGVVYGTTNINIGKDAVGDTSTTVDAIEIQGNIFGAGDSDLAPNRGSSSTSSYNYNYISVVGDTHIMIDNSIESPITFSGSIYGAGNGATYSNGTDTDNSTIHIKDLGTSAITHQITSIERTGRLFIEESFIELLGNQDANNLYPKASYTLNRIIRGVTIYNNTTLYTRRGFNMVGEFNSYTTTISEVTGRGNKANVSISNGVATTNVDNRLYTFEGVNLIFSKEEGPNTATSTNWGEVNGMTFFGMYALNSSGNKVYDIYDPNYTGGAIEDFFSNGTYIEGLHETNHNVSIDGFYTNVADYETDPDNITVAAQIIQPTPESATYYDWIIGADTVTYDISLIGSIFGDEATAELDLDYNYAPNAIYTLDRVSLNALNLGVNLINPLDITMISENANNTFGLTMETDTTGWLNRAETSIYSSKDVSDTTEQNNGRFVGDTTYSTDNTVTPGTIRFKMYNSLNITEKEDLGFVNLILTGKTITGSDPSIGNTFIIVIAVNLQTEAVPQIEDYVPRFTDTTLTELNYTTDSRVDISYLLFKDMETTPYASGDYRVISTSTQLPVGTKLTLKDYAQGESPVIYYYHVTSDTQYTTETIDGVTRYLYKLSDLFEMASTSAKYEDSNTYYHSEGYVLEKYDLSIDFIDANINTNNFAQETYLELRGSEGLKYDNGDSEITYNLHYNKNAIMTETLSNEGEQYSVIENTDIIFTVSVGITEQLTADGDKIMDTKYYDKTAGIAIEVLDEDGVRVILPAVQNLKLIDLDTAEEYSADESGVIRIPLLEGISTVTKNYKFTIAQNTVPPSNGSVKVYFFASDNGKHYGEEEKLEKQFYVLFVSKLMGLVGIESDAGARIISSGTGDNLSGTTGVDMTVSIGDAMLNTNIRLQLYKRNATYDASGNYTGTSYTLVDISDYLQGTWETPESYGLISGEQYEYILWKPESEEEITQEELILIELEKELLEDISTGEYKIVIKSYHDNTLVQLVRKTFIVTE